jgi:Flp pilus assembly protein TadD
MLKGDFGKAEEQFKIYLRLAPGEPNPHDCVGDLYMKMGRFDDAISQYEQAVKLDPQFALSQAKIGTSYILKGEYEEGRKALVKANVDEPFFIYYAAEAKEKAGDTAAAEKPYARVADWNEDAL